MSAYACRISEENMGAIHSEHPKFDAEATRAWLEEHEVGYFLRDPGSAFDCHYFEENVFLEMYAFIERDHEQLFRRVQRK